MLCIRACTAPGVASLTALPSPLPAPLTPLQALFEKFTVSGAAWDACGALRQLRRAGSTVVLIVSRAPVPALAVCDPTPVPPLAASDVQERSIKSVMLAQEEARRLNATEVRG